MKTYALASAFLLGLGFAACGEEDPLPPVPNPMPDGGGGAGGEGGGSSDGCASDGSGEVAIETSGLPDGVSIDGVLVRDGTRETAFGDSNFVSAGSYETRAYRLIDDDPYVASVYVPKVTGGTFCLKDGEKHTIELAYEKIPSSGKLWTSDLRAFSLAGIDGLTGAEAREPVVVGDGPIGKDVAFDRDGNLWSFGATLAEATLVRIPASALGRSGMNAFDRELNVPEVDCIPATRAMAFDSDGSLWLVVCGAKIIKLPAAELARSGDATASVVLGEVEAADLAFDADGNLWVASDDRVLRYDAERLDAATTEPADASISVRDAEDSRDLGVTALAFDADGSLWGFDFGSNFIFSLDPADADGTSEVTAQVSFALGVENLLDRGAFDRDGGLWVSYGAHGVARLASSQLTMSSGSGDPVTPELILTSDEIGNELRVALFPAPEGLPIYHHFTP